MQHQGRHLAELPRYYHALRGPYLKWADKHWDVPFAASLGNFRRALIGWYEATIDESHPYLGKTDDYVKEVARVYFDGILNDTAPAADRRPLVPVGLTDEHNPLNHLPRPIHLDERQQLMLRLFREMGTSCRELLLMTDYHRLATARIAEVIGMDDRPQEVNARRHKCLLMVREGWRAHGITDPVYLPSPTDEDLIDRYFAGLLDVPQRWSVEARRPGDAVFRHAMELREDWADVLVVTGRHDLMETLLREEERYVAQRTRPAAGKKVQLSPRKKTLGFGSLQLPALETVTGLVLFAVLCYLGFTTFGPAAPDRRAVAYFEPYPNIFDAYEPRTEDERDLERILYYYDRKDYQTAYEELLPTAPAYPAAPLYLGVSALALEQPGRALDWFVQIEDTDFYHPPAQWYEALAYLSLDRKPAALTLLREISGTPGHPFRDRAVRLLGEL